MWRTDDMGGREFLHGKDAWQAAARAAEECAAFAADVDEELVAEEERSCYNCRFRRWSATSFNCLKRV